MKVLVNHPLLSCCIPRGLGWSILCETHTFSPHGQCTAPSPELQCVHPSLISGRGPGQTAQRPLVHLWSYAVGARPAGPVPGCSGESHPPHPELSLPMAGIAHQLTSLTGQGRLQSCLKASLCRHNKGSCLPFSHSSAMELTSV